MNKAWEHKGGFHGADNGNSARILPQLAVPAFGPCRCDRCRGGRSRRLLRRTICGQTIRFQDSCIAPRAQRFPLDVDPLHVSLRRARRAAAHMQDCSEEELGTISKQVVSSTQVDRSPMSWLVEANLAAAGQLDGGLNAPPRLLNFCAVHVLSLQPLHE